MRILLCVLFTLPFLANAQLSEGDLSKITTATTITIREASAEEIPKNKSDSFKPGPRQFGVVVPLTQPISDRILQWSQLDNGTYGAAIEFFSGKARSLNFLFDQVSFSENDQMLCYDHQGQLRGLYAAKHVSKKGLLTTFPISGNFQKIVFVSQKPTFLRFSLKEGVFGFDDPAKDAEACNINANCPQGGSHRDQQKAVGVVLINGNSGCTGSLVNNTAFDGKPYILTAGHCIDGSYEGIPNWAFSMEYESPGCENANVVPDVYTGMEFKATEYASDAGLLLMDNIPSPPGGLYYLGWNAGTRNPREGFVFHHADSDIKKLAFDEDGSEAAVYPGSGDPFLFWQANWSLGTTERGSSGSSLLNDEKLAVGVLTGGAASCSNITGKDYFGRITDAFDYLPVDTFVNYTAFLDPSITRTTKLTGYDPVTDKPDFDLSIAGISIPTVICDTFCIPVLEIYNAGLNAVSNYNLSIISRVTGTVVSDTVVPTIASNETQILTLPSFLGFGKDTLEILISLAQSDARPFNNDAVLPVTFKEGENVDLQLTMDFTGSFNYWTITDSNQSVVGNGGPYEDGLNKFKISRKTCLQPDACYTLHVYDLDGNGINGGGYELYNQHEELLVDGWNSSANDPGNLAEDAQEFCLESKTSILVNSSVGITLKVFPNPTKRILYYEFPNKSGTPFHASIIDIHGRIVWSKSNIAHTEAIQLGSLANGLYTLQVQNNNSVYTARFVKR